MTTLIVRISTEKSRPIGLFIHRLHLPAKPPQVIIRFVQNRCCIYAYDRSNPPESHNPLSSIRLSRRPLPAGHRLQARRDRQPRSNGRGALITTGKRLRKLRQKLRSPFGAAVVPTYEIGARSDSGRGGRNFEESRRGSIRTIGICMRRRVLRMRRGSVRFGPATRISRKRSSVHGARPICRRSNRSLKSSSKVIERNDVFSSGKE